ncbi:centrosomal protein of 135 kDa-like [Rhincodon typus]|uniref:centrosomal protein of 135 kDa-like n=1 Tax=Rhincodon typus TaxID=259920 RepID=UPI00202EFABA|nr:centrosomal protein of 135 kDa-like [Rhincodon typus]
MSSTRQRRPVSIADWLLVHPHPFPSPPLSFPLTPTPVKRDRFRRRCRTLSRLPAFVHHSGAVALPECRLVCTCERRLEESAGKGRDLLSHNISSEAALEITGVKDRNKTRQDRNLQLNYQVEQLEKTNRTLERQIHGLLQSKEDVSDQVKKLINRNQELSKELNDINRLAEKLEKEKELALSVACNEIKVAEVG